MKVTTTVGANLRVRPMVDDRTPYGVVRAGFLMDAEKMPNGWYEIKGYLSPEVIREINPIPDANSPVPYRSQWDADANNRTADCGQACAAMLAEWQGVAVKINDLRFQSSPNGLSTSENLISNLKGVGIKAYTAKLSKGVLPPANSICLVNYGAFSRSSVLDKTYNGKHWMIYLSAHDKSEYVLTHDPDWWGTRRLEGANKAYEKTTFLAAFTGEFVAIG